jgi:hypothetical protein
MSSVSRKSSLVLFVLAFFVPIYSYSQSYDTLRAASASEKATAVSMRMKRELSLDEKQTSQVYDLCLKRFDIISKKGSGLGEQVVAANDSCSKSLATILSPQQYKIYSTLKAETKRQRQEIEQKQKKSYFLSKEDHELDL